MVQLKWVILGIKAFLSSVVIHQGLVYRRIPLAGIGYCYEFFAQWDTTSGGSDSRGLGFHTDA